MAGMAKLGRRFLDSDLATKLVMIDEYRHDVGAIKNVPYPKLYNLGDLIDKYTKSPLGGSRFEGVTDWMRGTAEDRDESAAEKYKRALWASLDLM